MLELPIRRIFSTFMALRISKDIQGRKPASVENHGQRATLDLLRRRTDREGVQLDALTGSILAGVASGSQVYFTHSFVAPVTGDTVAVTDHGEPFAAIVQRDHIAGVQFHPEKSGEVGLQILRNWLSDC